MIKSCSRIDLIFVCQLNKLHNIKPEEITLLFPGCKRHSIKGNIGMSFDNPQYYDKCDATLNIAEIFEDRLFLK